MQEPTPCPLRYIHKGRTFCAVAIRDRRYTTTEVVPGACEDCGAREVFEQARCRHLNLGVEIDQYGGAHDVSVFYASCERTVERIVDFSHCGEGKCPYWEPVDEDRLQSLRREALEAHREAELRQPD